MVSEIDWKLPPNCAVLVPLVPLAFGSAMGALGAGAGTAVRGGTLGFGAKGTGSWTREGFRLVISKKGAIFSTLVEPFNPSIPLELIMYMIKAYVKLAIHPSKFAVNYFRRFQLRIIRFFDRTWTASWPNYPRYRHRPTLSEVSEVLKTWRFSFQLELTLTAGRSNVRPLPSS